nr:ATP synthase F0 subunit 8 [Melanagromyza aenea]
MPQMSPISWLTLFMVFFVTFIVFNIMNYYCYFPLLFTNKSLMKNKTMNWKW